jgi:F0F1-type ATP synthase membrane subunit b/b'
MDDTTRDEVADQAARAARQAAAEASTSEARLFLREHANFLARFAAARRQAATRVGRNAAITVLLPLVERLPA